MTETEEPKVQSTAQIIPMKVSGTVDKRRTEDAFEPDFSTEEEREEYRNWKPLGDEESGNPNGPAGGRAGKSKKAESAPAPTTDIDQ